MFVFSYLIFAIIAVVLDDDRKLSLEGYGYGPIFGLFTITMVVPVLALGVRRLHDTGRTGWWSLILLVPLLGPIVTTVFFLQDSQPGENQYGPNPKADARGKVGAAPGARAA